MNRDLLYLKNEDIVIATDNCGSVGMQINDTVKADAHTTAYFTARVVLMELMSVHAIPIACSIQIFIEKDYELYLQGVKQALSEVNYPNIQIITTTESNFKMNESAFSITLIGKKNELKLLPNLNFGVIGMPLVGSETINNDNVVSLTTFTNIINDNNITEVLPVGSKGIKYEFENYFKKLLLDCNLDILKSAGPSTCVVVAYQNEEKIQNTYGKLFYKIKFKEGL